MTSSTASACAIDGSDIYLKPKVTLHCELLNISLLFFFILTNLILQ